MSYDTILSVSMSHDTKRQLNAVATVLGMSGKGAVVRAILDGRLAPLPIIPQNFTMEQLRTYERILNDE